MSNFIKIREPENELFHAVPTNRHDKFNSHFLQFFERA